MRLALPADAWVDIEAARDAVHRAESALALGEWGRAWGRPRSACSWRGVASCRVRKLDWAIPVRRELEEMYVRALETYATAALYLGGTELSDIRAVSANLVAAAPFRESGHRTLMRGPGRPGQHR